MPIKKKSFVFERPPAAPIFKPTLKEFEDPLIYIEKIRPAAQKYGICKIISPKQWNPPFAVDQNTFKFRPRVQRLNEIGAHSRIRNNFLRSIESYWEHHGVPLIYPIICRNVRIDLFELHDKVRCFGGSHQVTKNKQWTMICRELGMCDKAARQISSQVKSLFEKLIQPYLDFFDNKFMEENKELFTDNSYKGKTRGKTVMTHESPKMTRSKTQKIKKHEIAMCCNMCKSNENIDKMVTCVDCERKFHINCVEPSLSDVITSWTCGNCLKVNCARELSKLEAQVFGFSQSTCKYSLDSFSTYADNFKSKYFNNRQNVSLKEVEEEYWRLVAAEDDSDDVTVKYGADISSGQTSSGFPTKANRHLFSETDQKYVDDGWNLNNLPILNKSIFRFVSNDISGMTVPWCYVGMVFSCFCWHIEDHWSYSINYMHTGECKTWYGVPESDADKFEEVMRREAGQLFTKSPDLLHHITTQINPTVLRQHNVKVYRTDQAAGEFVVTFPRAYHAGFNQGFNFAEAVNFCPADWLSKGRASVESYRLVKRPSVFSHDELIFKMASSIDSLDILLLKAVHGEMRVIYEHEKSLRKQLLAQGNCRSERLCQQELDMSSEEDRECLHCRTTLYMSGVSRGSNNNNSNIRQKMTCLDHVAESFDDDNKDSGGGGVVLKYRLTLDEISSLVASLSNKLEQYNLWVRRLYQLAKSQFCSSPLSAEERRAMKHVCQFVEQLGVLKEEELTATSVGCSVEEKPNLEELKMLLQLGRNMNCPEILLDFLEAIIDTCQRAMSMTDQLLKSNNINNNDITDKLSLKEMRMLVDKLRSLPAHVPQLEEAAQTLYGINEWRKRVRNYVMKKKDKRVLVELLERGVSNLVYLSEYRMLERMKVYVEWTEECKNVLEVGDVTERVLPSLIQVKKMKEEGRGLINIVEIDKIATVSETLEVTEEEDEEEKEMDMFDYRLKGWNIIVEEMIKQEQRLSAIIKEGEKIEKEANNILKSKPDKCELSKLKSLLKSADSKLSCVVSSIEQLKDVYKEAVVINEDINEMWHKLQLCRRLVHIDDVQSLIEKAESLCVVFDHLCDLKTLNNAVESWRKKLQDLFFIKNSNCCNNVLEMLFPRPVRMFKLMIAREAVSSKLVAACKAESSVKKEEEELSRKSRGRQKKSSLSSEDPQLARKDNVVAFESFLKSLSSSTSPDTSVESFGLTYKKMCVDELEWMWNLRELNEDKANRDRGGHELYCLCRKRAAQVMCDLCQDWYHLSCLGSLDDNSTLSKTTTIEDMRRKKFLCPLCQRSHRPAFDIILTEKRRLEQESKMVIIPEHISLCFMSQRVISFHKHTNQLFSPQTELGAVFADYKKLFGVQAILPMYNKVSQEDHLSITGKQSRKTPHSSITSIIPPSQSHHSPPPPPSQPHHPPPPITITNNNNNNNKESLINIKRLKVSLSEEARRELEEIYIELCLLEVNQPTMSWIWKLYHCLIDDDDDDDDDDEEGDDGDGRSEQSEEEEHRLEGARKMVTMKKSGVSIVDSYIKRECQDNLEDRKEALGKFSFKRKLVGKNLQQSPTEVIKKQPIVKQITTSTRGGGVVTRKKGRGSKTSVSYRDSWERSVAAPPTISSEYYDEEDDVILLDNVETMTIKKEGNRKRTAATAARQSTAKTKTVVKASTSGSIKSASDTKSTNNEDNNNNNSGGSKQRLRQQQRHFVNQQLSTTDKSDEYSDEHSPSQGLFDIKVPQSSSSTLLTTQQLKRGRKPTIVGNSSNTTASSSRDNTNTTSSMKRRKRSTTTTGGGSSKRVCNDDCEADKCVQQSSDKVNWIACDKCNLWYHWLCVGIKSDFEIGDSFLCPRCKKYLHQDNIDNNDDLNVTLDDDDDDEDNFSIEAGGDTAAHPHLSSSSPPPPFLQPECCVQEEVVELSYLSHHTSDSE